jgi:hypothetical protein
MPRPCPAPTVPCPSWKSAWWSEISELLVQRFNRPSFFVMCCYHAFPRPWQTLFGFTLATCTWDWYASGNNLRGTPRGSRKKPKAGRSPIGRLSTAVLCRGLEKNSMVWARHGHGMASVNQTRPLCVNQMGKTHSKPLAARHGRGTAWARHAVCESAFSQLLLRGRTELIRKKKKSSVSDTSLRFQFSFRCVILYGDDSDKYKSICHIT